MPTDLYRWVNAEDGGPWVDTEDMRQELIADGVLVPVKPNLDAMSDALVDIMNYGLDEQDAQYLFDAALSDHR